MVENSSKNRDGDESELNRQAVFGAGDSYIGGAHAFGGDDYYSDYDGEPSQHDHQSSQAFHDQQGYQQQGPSRQDAGQQQYGQHGPAYGAPQQFHPAQQQSPYPPQRGPHPTQANNHAFAPHPPQPPTSGSGTDASRKKKAPWLIPVVAVAALALVGGLVWGGIALFSKGGSDEADGRDGGGEATTEPTTPPPGTATYPLETDEDITSASVSYTGSWEYDATKDIYLQPEGQCAYQASHAPDPTLVGVRHSNEDLIKLIEEQASATSNTEITGSFVEPYTLGTTSDDTVQFALMNFTSNAPAGTYGEVFAAVHVYGESGETTMMMLACVRGKGELQMLKDRMQETSLTITK